MALDIPARDQPVSADIGSRYTASENIDPIATHVINAPAATITQRYESFMAACLHPFWRTTLDVPRNGQALGP
jgi:hypothetical protein